MSAKELLDRYSEYLNQTRFDPTTESSTYQVYTERNLVDTSPIEFDTAIPKRR